MSDRDQNIMRRPRWGLQATKAAVLVAIVSLAVYFGWRAGRGNNPSAQNRDSAANSFFAVSGNSMAPTLVGEGKEIVCPQCQRHTIVDAPCVQQNAGPGHAAGKVQKVGRAFCVDCDRAFRSQDFEAGKFVLPDAVIVRPIAGNSIRRGEMVSVTWEGTQRVKRVLGLPGDTISLDEHRLLVNGERLEDLIARDRSITPAVVSVSGNTNRWRQSKLDESWQSDARGLWSASSASDYLSYAHHDVNHQDSNALHELSPVMDDYPINACVERKLYSVDRLMVNGTGRWNGDVTLELAFWTTTGTRSCEVTARGSSDDSSRKSAQGSTDTINVFAASVYNCDETNPDDASGVVYDEMPIAIRVVDGEISELALVVSRFVEYRLARNHSRDAYPMTLAKDEFFVVGDNVPTSVDSREIGPVKAEWIRGVCERMLTRVSE